MKSAAEVATKFAERAANASQDYVRGAETTTKDQSTNAIAAKGIWKQAIDAAAGRDAFAKGLTKSGKAGWIAGIKAKGGDRFASGVTVAAPKYAEGSGKYDQARKAADAMPRGLKGSDTNLARVKAVVAAQRAVKVAA